MNKSKIVRSFSVKSIVQDKHSPVKISSTESKRLLKASIRQTSSGKADIGGCSSLRLFFAGKHHSLVKRCSCSPSLLLSLQPQTQSSTEGQVLRMKWGDGEGLVLKGMVKPPYRKLPLSKSGLPVG
jgi:hypothetical protein